MQLKPNLNEYGDDSHFELLFCDDTAAVVLCEKRLFIENNADAEGLLGGYQ